MYKITIKDLDTGKSHFLEGEVYIVAAGTKNEQGLILGKHSFAGSYSELCRLHIGSGAAVVDVCVPKTIKKKREKQDED